MTVQELIDKLLKIQDKNLNIVHSHKSEFSDMYRLYTLKDCVEAEVDGHKFVKMTDYF